VTRRSITDPTAVVARRGGAWFIDVVLCGLAAAVPTLLLADAYALDRAGGGLELEWHEGDVGVFVRDTAIVLRQTELAIILGALLAAVLLLVVILPGRRGGTPGHLAADLRIVRGDGSRAGIFRALVRTVAWVIDILPGLPLVAYGSARLTRRHQRVGDLLARTYVVDKRAAGRPVDRPLTEDGAVGTPRVEPEPEPVPEPRPEPSSAPRPVDAEPEAEPTRQVPPEPTPQPAPRPGAAPPAGVPVDEPIWDRRHKRYVLWHSKAGRWLTHGADGWAPLESAAPGDAPPGD